MLLVIQVFFVTEYSSGIRTKSGGIYPSIGSGLGKLMNLRLLRVSEDLGQEKTTFFISWFPIISPSFSVLIAEGLYCESLSLANVLSEILPSKPKVTKATIPTFV